MHGYFWSRKKLKKKLAEFNDGQFLIERLGKEGEEFPIDRERKLILRCEIKDWSIPDMKKNRVIILFGRLWELSFGVDVHFNPIPKWELFQPPEGCSTHLDIEYTSYYFQRRKKRIKMWTPQGETCRFYRKDDLSNVRLQDEQFVPAYEPPKPDAGPHD